jgi:hypothetical protein
MLGQRGSMRRPEQADGVLRIEVSTHHQPAWDPPTRTTMGQAAELAEGEAAWGLDMAILPAIRALASRILGCWSRGRRTSGNPASWSGVGPNNGKG